MRWTGEELDERKLVRLIGEPSPELRAALQQALAEDRCLDVIQIRSWTQ